MTQEIPLLQRKNSREWTAKAGVLEKKRLEFLTWRNPQETKSLIMVGKNEPIQTGNKTP